MTNWGVSGFAPADWHEFFNAAVGASAALLGLLFVAISINLKLILKHRHLPGRAAGTLGTLLSVLVVCSFGLVPGQSNRALGVEILATGAVVATQAIWVSVGKRSEGDPLTWTLGNLPILLFPALAFVGGGCSLLAGSGGGLYWILAGTVLTFVGTTLNAWVLLVEIVR
jgi:modulator of FtsH protease